MGGMETLLNTLIKSMGFDPKVFINSTAEFIAKVETTLAQFDQRMSAMEVLLSQIHAATVKPEPAMIEAERTENRDAA